MQRDWLKHTQSQSHEVSNLYVSPTDLHTSGAFWMGLGNGTVLAMLCHSLLDLQMQPLKDATPELHFVQVCYFKEALLVH